MVKIEDYTMDGWPTGVEFMDTSCGMQCFVYRKSEISTKHLEYDLGDLREDRAHPLTGRVEKTYTHTKFDNNGPIGYSGELYTPLVEAKTRVIRCLQGKLRENFAL